MSMDVLWEWLPLILTLIPIAALAGFLAGLLGIGGGVVLVPGLYYALSAAGYGSSSLMHIAVGTSLAVIVPTGFSSARAHWRKGAVRLDLVKRIGIGVVIGVALGSVIADHLSGHALKVIFATAIMVLAIIMLSNPSRYTVWSDVPKQPWSGLAGVFIGAVSTLIGIGGATLSVPYMSLCKVPIHKAIGTAAALGLVISIPGMLGFILIGWGEPSSLPLSLGYVNLLAWLIIVPVSVAVAPLGALTAHKVPVGPLRNGFAVFMVLVAARMIYGVLHG